jgi:hypothetical protein
MINIFKKSSTPKLDQVTKENKCKNPWLITKVVNGLKAVNGKPTSVKFFINKNFEVQYYEYDRIFGKGAFNESGFLRVTDLFKELKNITPYTEYFIFKDHLYINREDGILKKHHKTGEETFFSNKTLQNENIANYFSLSYSDEPIIEESEIEIETNEDDNDRPEVYSESTELEKI